MDEDVFWRKQRDLGPIHVFLGRNDAIYTWQSWKRRKRVSLNVSRIGWQVFITFRVKTYFINVDIV